MFIKRRALNPEQCHFYDGSASLAVIYLRQIFINKDSKHSFLKILFLETKAFPTDVFEYTLKESHPSKRKE